ncbi:MAG: hypothetical protein R3F60_06885 [bacterium]
MKALACMLLLAVFGCEPATLRASGDPPEPISPVKGPDQLGVPDAPPTDAPARPGPDGEPPAPATPPAVLTVTAPPRGARVLGNTLRVQGTVEGGTAPQVTVAGQPATLGADRAFTVDVPVSDGLAVIVTEMVDGATRSADHRAAMINADQDPATPVPSAADVGISAAGFQVISQLASGFAAGADLGGLVGGNGQVRRLTYGRIDLQLRPGQDALELELSIYDLYIEIETSFRIIFEIDVRGSMRANPARITARIRLVPDGNGSMSLQVEGARADLQNFSYNINNVPGEVEDWFEGTVRDTAEDLLADTLNDLVVPNLFDPAALNQELDLLGKKVDLAMAIDQVRIDPSAMHLALSASATPQISVYPGKAARPVGGVDAPVDPAHMDIALAADFVNRILHAVWAAGALDLELGGEGGEGPDLGVPLTAGLLAGALGAAGQGISPAAPLLIRTRALLAPYCTLQPGERPLRITMGDFLLELATANESIVTLAVHLDVDVGLEADETGQLQPQIELVQHVDVAETPRGPVNEPALEGLIGGIISQLPTLLAQGLAADPAADPMPAAPTGLINQRFVAAGVFLHILGDIDPNPPAP